MTQIKDRLERTLRPTFSPMKTGDYSQLYTLLKYAKNIGKSQNIYYKITERSSCKVHQYSWRLARQLITHPFALLFLTWFASLKSPLLSSFCSLWWKYLCSISESYYFYQRLHFLRPRLWSQLLRLPRA